MYFIYFKQITHYKQDEEFCVTCGNTVYCWGCGVSGKCIVVRASGVGESFRVRVNEVLLEIIH